MKEILIIHDSPIVICELADVLETGSYRPMVVTDPVTGWDYLKNNAADALVTKVGFPAWKPHGLAIARMGVAGGRTRRVLFIDNPPVFDHVGELHEAKIATLSLATPLGQIVKTLESLLA